MLNKLRRWQYWGATFDAGSLALAAPAVIFPRAMLAPLLLAVPAAWAVRRWRGGRWLDSTPLNVPMLLLVIMLLVSLYATYSLGQSLSKIAGLIFSIGVFYAIVRWVGTRRAWQWALGGFLAMESAVAIVGLIGSDWIAKTPILIAITKRLPSLALSLPGAPEGLHPNEVAGVLLWGGPPALAAALLALSRLVDRDHPGGRGRKALILAGKLLAFILIWGTLVLTQSRSAWLGAGASLLGIGAVLVNHKLPFRPGAKAAIWASVLVVAIGVAAWFGPKILNDAGASEVVASASGRTFSVATLQGRIEIWSRAVYGIEDFPLTGMGMNTFRKIVPVLYPLFTMSPDFDIAHAHNQLLQAALDLGLPGLIAYLSLWLGAGWYLWQVWRRRDPLEGRAWALGLGGALLGSFVYGMTDAVALGARPGFLWWYLLGLVVGLYRISGEAGGREKVTGNREQGTGDRKSERPTGEEPVT